MSDDQEDSPAVLAIQKAILDAPRISSRAIDNAATPVEIYQIGDDAKVLAHCRPVVATETMREMAALVAARAVDRVLGTEPARVPPPPVSKPLARIRTVNDIGAGMFGMGTEKMRDLRVYPESGRVQIWFEMKYRDTELEVMQYLTASEAMAFARAFERCAIQALKDQSE